MSDHDGEIIELYRARNLPEAYAIRLLMEREEIAVSIANEILQGIIGETAMGWSTSPRLMVKRQDAERARVLLLRHLEHAKLQERSTVDDIEKCLACGAVMNGDATCAVCGWSYGEEEPESALVSNSEPASQPSRDEDTPRHQEVPNRNGQIAAISETPVLPVREVWCEVAAVMCIGWLPHLADALLLLNSNTYPYWEYASHVTLHGFASTFATLYIIHRSQESWRQFGIGWPSLTDGVLGFMLMIVMWYFGSIVYYGVKDSLAPEDGNSGMPQTSVEFIMMPIMIIIAALSEEVIMRCYLITRLRQLTHRPWLSVVVASLMFALYHSYQGLPGFVHSLFVGLLLSAVFALYPRIWPLVMSHAAYNLAMYLNAMRNPGLID